MNEDKPNISVIIITYNQEDVIGRAIESVLIQKEWVHEIIICDDCSTDNNWKIITEYQNNYSGLIKSFRHEKNLGIFGNIESTWSKPTGNLILYLAGDDAICNGIFEKANKFIEANNIDFTKGSFCLYSDSKIVSPDGKECLRSNKMISKGYDAVSLKIRGLVGSSRGVFYSKELVKRFKSVRKDIGIYADGLIDIQVQMYSDYNYYMDFIGAIYYAGIGIGSRTPTLEQNKSRLLCLEEFEKLLKLNKKDKCFIQFQKAHLSFSINPTSKGFFDAFKYYFQSIEIKYGINIKKDAKLFGGMLLRLL